MINVKKYQTKPCIIEAVEWTGINTSEIFDFGNKDLFMKDKDLFIHTLEGDMKANVGDYIIKGLRGEFYPCKPDVFHSKYEEVN